MEIREITGSVVFLAGAIFLFLGGLGVLRMPDLYNRIQAGTKATTLGALLSCAGIAIIHPDWIARLTILSLFILLTNPVSSHVLARAAHRAGVEKYKGTAVDALESKEDREN